MDIKAVKFRYRNYKGEYETREIIPLKLEFLTTPGRDWHYQPGWFLTGKDLDRGGQLRSFALSSILLDEDYSLIIPLEA